MTIKLLATESMPGRGDCNQSKSLADEGQHWRGKQVAIDQGIGKLKRRRVGAAA